MSDVFVSYKTEDRRRVKPLVEALEGEGFSVWWDEQIGGGTAWRQSIETELNAAKCVIVVWSDRSVGPAGEFVQDEAARAKQRQVYVPVLIDKVHLPLGFGETQALPLIGWRGNRREPKFQAVLGAVRRIVGEDRLSAGTAPAGHAIDRRTAIAGGAVAVAIAGGGAWALLKPSSAHAGSDSIAVLPFENLSGDPSQAYFSDGIAEELRSALARIAGLRVVGRTSSEAVRSDDAQTVARKLAVANILTGSVRRSATMIRISAQLVNGGSGLERWSQDYDRSPGDALKIESDIAEQVARALAITLGRASQRAIAVGGTQNAAAHDLYLKGLEVARSDESEDGMRRATGLFDSSISLDPKFAEALAQKAIALVRLTGYYGSPATFASGSAEGATIARQAISLAPDLVSGHAALALVLTQQLNMKAALTEYQRAYALAPGDVDNLLLYSRFLAFLGSEETASNLARQAQQQDPLNAIAYSTEGMILRAIKRYDEAASAYRRALEIAPKRLVSRALLAAALMGAGKIPEAMAETEKLPSDYLFRLANESVLFCRQGNRAASSAKLSRAQQLYGDSLSFQYATIYAQCGDADRAIAWLEKAWSIRDPGLASIKAEPLLDPVRSDARFGDVIRKMNFPA